jgi:2,3-bisphosphoglycerate-independent phosphoglycerate mutase
MKKLVFIFVDGVGISHLTTHNPLFCNELDVLRGIIHNESMPIDATMGVDGTPQSATGQTSLLCGINAQKAVGRHEEGFPGKTLKQLIKKENIFKKLAEAGKTGTFSNGYWLTDLNALDRKQRKMMSVTTVAAQSGAGLLRTMEYLVRGQAVYQDITQAVLRARGADVPLLSEEEAAKRLVRISREFDFTLFEYFQSDIAGHRQDREAAITVLSSLQRFISRLLELIDFGSCALMIASDHGNIEDLSTSGHTRNPVPFFVKGPDEEALRSGVKDLSGVVPAVLKYLAD